jgi:ATP-binding cassette subfamily B protein
MKILRKFYSYVWKFKYFFISATILNIFMAILNNILPLLFRDVVNFALDGETEFLFRSVLLISSIVFVTYLGDTFTMYISDFALFGAAAKLKKDVLKHLHDLDFSYHANKSSGRLISVFKRGEGAFFSFYDEINIWMSRVVFDFIIIVAIYSTIYPKLIVITVIAFFINAVVMYFTVKNNVNKRKSLNIIEDEVNSQIVDNMIAFDSVKYFANEKYEQKRFSKVVDNWYQGCIKYAKTFRVIDLSNGGISNVAFLVTIVISIIDLVNGVIDAGDFVLAVAFANTFYPKIKYLVFQFREVAKNYEDLKSYINILDEEITVVDHVKRISPENQKLIDDKDGKLEIIFKDLTFGYDEKRPIFNNLNLTISEGESVALVGHSGVGKTTIVKLLMRFFDPISGDIFINGVNIKDIPKQSLRKLIAMVPQEASLFNNTIGYNIGYGNAGRYSTDQLDRASRKAYLTSFISQLPRKYDTEIGERGVKLSGGQKQRLAIARAFIKEAPIIILDEATSNLDSISEREIQQAFWELSADKTTIVIAHRLSTIERVDRILVFDKGQIVEDGNHRDLIHRENGIYKYLWELQSSGAIS